MPEKLDRSLVQVRERIEKGMRGSADLILDEFQIAGVKGLAFMFDGLVSNSQVSDFCCVLFPVSNPRTSPPRGCGIFCSGNFYSAASRAWWITTMTCSPGR